MPERLEPVVNLIIDNRLDSYASFFDHDWAKSFGELSDKSRLQLPGCDLTRDWKGIAVAGRMPWLMIDSLQRFHVGFTTTNPPFYKLLTTHLGEYLLKRSKQIGRAHV